MNNIKNFLLDCFLIAILAITFLGINPASAQETQDKTILPSEIGVVQSVETFGDITPSESGELKQAKQIADIKITSGEHKGEKVLIDNNLMGNPAYDIHLKKGEKVILHVETSDKGTDFFIADKYRVGALYFLAFLFCALLVIVGKKKGFFSLISIGLTLALLFLGLTPMILSGMNPILATVIISMLASIGAIYLVGGINSKSLAAVLGTVISLVIAGVLSILVIKTASLTGFSSEECLFLFSAHPEINLVGILASAMIIGALGAVMDIGMTIASTINEIYQTNNDMGIRELFDSGLNVGRDIIGTMANTLILAYVGSALPLVLLSGNIDMQKFFNLNQVATEISSALVGSVALVLCVPITAIITAYLLKNFKPKDIEQKDFGDIIQSEE